ncbi:MAG: hypothetical protein JWM41_3304 [Gemmatimonadetes bacterium]|nr:hypothetical protein [Gemmatimonadota bacterium]
MKRLAGVAFAMVLAVIASAHVGSPNVLFDGNAGPYPVRVIVRPPEVVPGLAEVVVRADAPDVERVVIRPVFWRAGVAGAPAGDAIKRVAGQDRVYSGQLWLMAYGSYSVYVTVSGPRGTGTAIVPVASFATGRLPLSRGLSAVLLVLGALLVVGFLTIIRAASGESLVTPGDVFDAPRRRKANLVTAVAAPLLALLLFGGAKWWSAEDGRYRRNMYGAPAAVPSVAVDASHRTLRLDVHDTAFFRAIFVPVAPDHGKMMHLFLVDTHGMSAFAHLHPSQRDSAEIFHSYTAEVPAIPAGRYRLFGDITLENGLSLTVSNTVDIPATKGSVTPSDADDAWNVAPAVPRAVPGAVDTLGDGYTMAWSGGPTPLAARTPVDLRFTVRDARGAVTTLQPYLGMAGHAVVIRDDQSVFIHLHPMGTVATAAQQIFVARDRGDTTVRGRLNTNALDSSALPDMSAMSMSGALSFPYEFPKPGRYRIWIQAKPHDRVLTGTFDVDVH